MEDKIKELISGIRQDVCKAHNDDRKAHIRTIEAYIELKSVCNEIEASGLVTKADPIEEWESDVIGASNDAIYDAYEHLEVDYKNMEGEDEITLELVELSNLITNVFFSGAVYGSENPRPESPKK